MIINILIKKYRNVGEDYNAIDYEVIDPKLFASLPFDDCRKDADLNKDQELTIGINYGASFNCMVVGQRFSRFHLKNTSDPDEVQHLKSF